MLIFRYNVVNFPSGFFLRIAIRMELDPGCVIRGLSSSEVVFWGQSSGVFLKTSQSEVVIQISPLKVSFWCCHLRLSFGQVQVSSNGFTPVVVTPGPSSWGCHLRLSSRDCHFHDTIYGKHDYQEGHESDKKFRLRGVLGSAIVRTLAGLKSDLNMSRFDPPKILMRWDSPYSSYVGARHCNVKSSKNCHL